MSKSESFALTVIALLTCGGWFVTGWLMGNMEMDAAMKHAYDQGLIDGKAIQGTVEADGPEKDG